MSVPDWAVKENAFLVQPQFHWMFFWKILDSEQVEYMFYL